MAYNTEKIFSALHNIYKYTQSNGTSPEDTYLKSESITLLRKISDNFAVQDLGQNLSILKAIIQQNVNDDNVESLIKFHKIVLSDLEEIQESDDKNFFLARLKGDLIRLDATLFRGITSIDLGNVTSPTELSTAHDKPMTQEQLINRGKDVLKSMEIDYLEENSEGSLSYLKVNSQNHKLTSIVNYVASRSNSSYYPSRCAALTINLPGAVLLATAIPKNDKDYLEYIRMYETNPSFVHGLIPDHSVPYHSIDFGESRLSYCEKLKGFCNGEEKEILTSKEENNDIFIRPYLNFVRILHEEKIIKHGDIHTNFLISEDYKKLFFYDFKNIFSFEEMTRQDALIDLYEMCQGIVDITKNTLGKESEIVKYFDDLATDLGSILDDTIFSSEEFGNDEQSINYCKESEWKGEVQLQPGITINGLRSALTDKTDERLEQVIGLTISDVITGYDDLIRAPSPKIRKREGENEREGENDVVRALKRPRNITFSKWV